MVDNGSGNFTGGHAPIENDRLGDAVFPVAFRIVWSVMDVPAENDFRLVVVNPLGQGGIAVIDFPVPGGFGSVGGGMVDPDNCVSGWFGILMNPEKECAACLRDSSASRR